MDYISIARATIDRLGSERFSDSDRESFDKIGKENSPRIRIGYAEHSVFEHMRRENNDLYNLIIAGSPQRRLACWRETVGIVQIEAAAVFRAGSGLTCHQNVWSCWEKGRYLPTHQQAEYLDFMTMGDVPLSKW